MPVHHVDHVKIIHPKGDEGFKSFGNSSAHQHAERINPLVPPKFNNTFQSSGCLLTHLFVQVSPLLGVDLS